MSDQTNEAQSPNDELVIDELAMLKQRAKMMGIVHSNNISLETLKEKIAAKMAGDTAAATQDPVQAQGLTGDEGSPGISGPVGASAPAPVKTKTLRQYVMEQNMKLVRIRVTCLDPKKKEWPGEFLTVANEHLGTVTKYVPFGEATDNGYHVPYCIYKMMKNRKFLSIRTFKDRQNHNQIKVEQRWANEFAIEVLDPLTPKELAQLAAAQAAAGGLD